jgi:nicotinamide mononucleotide adenylyltransferase
MRVTLLASALALGTFLAALPVAAHTQSPAPASIQDERDAKFPMTAAEFREHVSQHLTKARARMEEHVARLPAEEAQARRAHFEAAVAQISAKVDEVCADGTVTKEEAEAVHELSRSLLHHRHHAD